MFNYSSKNFVEYLKLIFVPSIIVVAALIGQYIRPYISSFSEWVPFLFVALSAPIAVILFHIIDKPTTKKTLIPTVVIGLLCSIATLVMLSTIYQSFQALWTSSPTHTTTIIAITLIIITSLAITKFSVSRIQHTHSSSAYIFTSIIVLIFSITNLCGLFELPNWSHFMAAIASKKIFAICSYLICTSCILFLVFSCYDKKQLLTNNNITSSHGKQFLIISILIFSFVISFRYDTLINCFPSFYHWEYFIGPIRTIRNGGWLLWDAPSQYGFLNILLPSLLPIKSSWHSLYIFQGTLLFLAFIMLFKISCSKTDKYSKILIAFLVTTSALYFADPDLIGPYLYPSSSVVRFFWCYVFLFLLHLYNKNTINIKWFAIIGSTAWVFAVLWSAESTIYSSLTFYPALLVAALQQEKNIKNILLRLSLPLIMLSGTIVCISLYYHHFLGHFPDWINFAIYGLSYAAGFGSMPIKNIGSVWILILLFINAVNLLANVSKKNLYDHSIVAIIGITGCLLGISTYFVGRTVPNNITAMLPILVTIALFLLNLSNKKSETFYLLVKILAIPVLLIAIITTIGNQDFVTKIHAFRTFSSHITKALPRANEDFLNIIQKAKISTTDPIVYHSYAGGFPMIKENGIFKTNEVTWLPSPIILLEEPITEQRKQLIINRFLERIHRSGFLIHDNGINDDRYLTWLNLLNKYFIQEYKITNKSYTVIYFRRMPTSPSAP